MSPDAPLRYDLGGYKPAANGRVAVNLFGDSDIHHDIRELAAFISEDGVVDEFYLSHLLYRGTGTSFAQAYCVHLWEQFAWEPYLEDLDVDFIRSVDNNFNRLARRFLDS